MCHIDLSKGYALEFSIVESTQDTWKVECFVEIHPQFVGQENRMYTECTFINSAQGLLFIWAVQVFHVVITNGP